LKPALLGRLDAVLDPSIVIASSSSGLLMSRVQIDCRHPEAAIARGSNRSRARAAVGLPDRRRG
jgi:hypothetical protein